MLVAAMVGLDARSTMDLDATIKGANVNVEDIENLISSIVTVPIDDGVKFQLKSISEIMDEAEYPGIRVSMCWRRSEPLSVRKLLMTGGCIAIRRTTPWTATTALKMRF